MKTGADLPQFIFIHLPNDHMAAARPEDGYPYEESFVVDNDYALGRILEYLSGTKWWKETAVFITEDDAQGGVDHIDSHRTVLLCAGPWIKKHYVSHVNTSFPGLLKTIFRSAEASAAQPVRRVGRRIERLLRRAAGPGALPTARCGPPHFRPRQSPDLHQREALAQDGRSQGSGTVRLSGTGA